MKSHLGFQDCRYKHLLEERRLVPDTSYYILMKRFRIMLWKYRTLELGGFGGFQDKPYISQMMELRSREIN